MVVYLVLRLKNYALSILFIPLIHLALLELFAASLYLLYFLTLGLTIYFLYLKKFFLSKLASFYILAYWLGIFLCTLFFEDAFYDIYIDLNLSFTLHYISKEVIYSLTLLHLFILFLLRYNGEKLIEGSICT